MVRGAIFQRNQMNTNQNLSPNDRRETMRQAISDWGTELQSFSERIRNAAHNVDELAKQLDGWIDEALIAAAGMNEVFLRDLNNTCFVAAIDAFRGEKAMNALTSCYRAAELREQ
jgi:hypothetical protein